MTDGSGGGSVGINPDLLQSMINSMKSSTGNALNLVNGYISAFGQYGLDTSSLTKAVQDLTWAQGQLPMLSRRQSMAQAVAEETPGLTVTPAGAGPLDYATNAAAAAAGKTAGQHALEELTDRQSDQEILAELQKSGDDPSYVAAFFQALGPQGLTALGIQVLGYQQGGQTSQYNDWVKAVGTAFGTATFTMPYSQGFLENLHPPMDIEDDPTDPELSTIAPFLDYGVVSPTWLKPLGQYALTTAYAETAAPGGMTPVDLDPIWTAISKNSSFAAQYYSQNFNNKQNPNESLSGLMSNPMSQWVDDSAFASMVQSATIPPKWATNGATAITPWSQNAQLTVQTFGGQDPSVPLSGSIRAVFGTIAMNYFDNLADSVRAAAPGVGSQNMPNWLISADPGTWANFVQEAMQNKATAAQMLTFYGAWVKQNEPVDWTQDPNVPMHQGFWNHTSLGFLNDFMAANYQAAGSTAGKSTSDVLTELLAAGGSSFLTSLVFGPEAGVADALLDGAKDTFQSAAEDGLTTAFSGGPDSSSGGGGATDLTSAQAQWDITVREWADPSTPGVPPGLTHAGLAVMPVTYMGKPYDGNVHTYEQEYGGTFFDDQTGQLLSLSKIQANTKALEAYNAWLQDPAIVAANGQAFATTSAGQTWSGYARGFGSDSGSGGG
jgi:hypothetical protein